MPTAPPVPRRAWLLPTMHPYQSGWVRTDVLAGVAAGTVVIPQAMAYATIAGLPVQIGLYTCMLPMLVYALLGGSRTASVSTTSTIAVLVATTLAGVGDQGQHQVLRDAFTLTFLVGIALLVMRLFRLGSLIENVSPATLTGIKAGVGLTVAAGQLPKLLGIGDDPEASAVDTVTLPFLDTLRSLQEDLARDDVHLHVAAMGASALAVAERSEWFAEQRREGTVHPTVDDAVGAAARSG